jgi:hypothetical protein
VGFLAVIDGLRGAGFGGDLDVGHADFAGGAARLVDGHPHALADEFDVRWLDARLDEIDDEFRFVGDDEEPSCATALRTTRGL